MHVFFRGVDVAYVAGRVVVAILCKVTQFSTIETGSLGLGAMVVLLWLGGCCIVVSVVVLLRVCSIGVGIVASVLLTVVGCSGARYIHGH